MNERIKELAIEYATQLDWDPPKDPAFYGYNSIQVEKFAQSIVNECLHNMQNCDGDLDFAIWNTKQDFGV